MNINFYLERYKTKRNKKNIIFALEVFDGNDSIH
jgi:hypothetical protein